MPAATPGRFVWYDLFTTDQEASKKFYADLLGWQYENYDMGGADYPMIKVGEAYMGGIASMKDPAAAGPPHWTSYVSVEDVDATCKRVEELGGKVVVSPTDIPTVGRFAVIADPQGAIIAPFKPLKPSEAEEPEVTPEGMVCWRECLCGDSAAVAEFYRQVFGWRVETQDMDSPGGGTNRYHLFYAGEKMIGGTMDMPPQAAEAGAPPHWLYYLKVTDVDALAAKTTELGGSVACPPMDIPGIGRFCVIDDPQGATVALYRPHGKE
jgi:predicted enzyme related to lactoylglutathione lyase